IRLDTYGGTESAWPLFVAQRRPGRHFHARGLISSFVAFRRALRKGDLGMQGTLRFVRLRPRSLLAALSLLVLSMPVIPVEAVTVGDIDTGLDYTHPDLAANVDFANSVSCINNGVPDPNPAAWNDENGHGTHTAGTIAAAHNGIGIVGVAPNVKVAGIRAGNAAGFFFPESVVCAFMWAGTHHAIKVTNNSYFADPWLFNCKNDPGQRAIWKAESRAIKFAMQQGVTVVAAAGNEADDLAHPTQDVTSPD